jgi:hypothetical protein
MKKIILYILLFFLNITFSFSQNNPDFSFTDVVNNPKAIIKYYKKIESNTISDSVKYKLACANYSIGFAKKNGREKNLIKALSIFKLLENSEKYKVNSLFRQGLCNMGLFQLDSAYVNFNDLLSLNPKIQEAYYFKAFSFYYSKNYSQRTKKDTLDCFKLINEMNLIIQITSDTNKLKLLAEATHNLKNFLHQYSVFDSKSLQKISGLIDQQKYYYPMKSSLLYKLDSIPQLPIDKGIFELYATLKINYFNPLTNSYVSNSMPFKKLSQTTNLQTILGLPDTLSIDSFQLSLYKVTRGYKFKGDTLDMTGSYDFIGLKSYSSKLTDEMVDVIRKLTINDDIYFEYIFTTKIKDGFIPPTTCRIILSEM